MFKAKWIPAAAATLGLFAASSSFASSLSPGDVVEVDDITANGTLFVPGLRTTGLSITVDGVTRSPVAAGLFDLAYRHDGQDNWTKFKAFCLNPGLPLDLPEFFAVTESASDALAELFGRFYGSIVNGTTAAAFQVAIWEIVTDGLGGSLAAGDFILNNKADIAAQAAAWLAALDGTGPKAKLVELDSRSGEVQDLITVPEPASLALLGLGLLGIGLARRRRS